MALLGVNEPQPDQRKPSALDNAAKVLGIVTSLGGAGASGYNALVTAPAQAAAAQTTANAMKTMAANPGAYQSPIMSAVMGNPNPMNLPR